MGLSNRVLIDGEGRVVVAESGQPQVTNDDGGSCCCNCLVALPSNYSDNFSGYSQATNLFATDEAVKPYEFPFPNAAQPYVNHQPALPYTSEQLQNQNENYQLIALKSGQGKNGGKTDALMWNGRDTLVHPWWTNLGSGGQVFTSNIGDTIANVKPSDFDAAYSNYSPNDATQSWRTSANIIWGEDCSSHGLAYNYESEELEKPTMGHISQIGIWTGAPLHVMSQAFGTFTRPRLRYGFSMTVSRISHVMPNANPDFVQGEDEPFLLFPYVYETERHLKKVQMTWPTLTDPNPFGGVGTKKNVREVYLPVQSGDELAIEINVQDHKVVTEGKKYGRYFFCVRFLINGVPILTEPASSQGYVSTGSERAAADNPVFDYYCSFGHGVTLNSSHNDQYEFQIGYYDKWNEWAIANDQPDWWNPAFGFPWPQFSASHRYFNWAQNNVNDFSTPNDTVVYIYTPDYMPRVGGFTSYNHTMSNESLDFNCGVVNEPDPVVMLNFANATGRTIDPPPTTTPPTLVLTYPYNWANISTIIATSFAAVLTGATSPLTYNIETGSLPSGLSLDTTTGLVSGTPSGSGSGSVSIKVVDTNSATDTSPVYSWNVTGMGGGGGP